MQCYDLNEEVEADDWLIPSHEIARRRLIKQTPRYNIYKADWFGEVLVYEPVEDRHEELTVQVLEPRKKVLSRKHSLKMADLSSRLDELNLETSEPSPKCWTSVSRGLLSPGSDCDSAYSSISSTPRFQARPKAQCEFEFPGSSSSSWSQSSSLGSSLAAQSDHEEWDVSVGPVNSTTRDKCKNQVKQPSSKTPTVILNKNSFTFGCLADVADEQAHQEQQSQTKEGSSICWTELNELRLIAHESFMLFMGASTGATPQDDQATSLVIQMNHAKASSLYNLLHARKLAESPLDRFFAAKQQHQQQLGAALKLHVCQQVTNAMTYLHDKNIVHAKLTSVNIYLEHNQRVKISLIDNDERALVSCAPNSGGPRFHLPSLTSLAPELVSSIRLAPAQPGHAEARRACDKKRKTLVQLDTREFSKKSDVFSFGTLLFELFEERFPFTQTEESQTSASELLSAPTRPTPSALSGPPATWQDTPLSARARQDAWNGNITTPVHELIFQICSGQTAQRNLSTRPGQASRIPPEVRQIILACWELDPSKRPDFKQLSFA